MTTTAPDPGTEAGSGPIHWRADRDYSTEWNLERFVQHWTSQSGSMQSDRTPPMCSLCGVFIKQAPPPQTVQADGNSDQEMDDNFRVNRLDAIVDEGDNDDDNERRDEVENDDEDDDRNVDDSDSDDDERSEDGDDENRNEDDGESDRDEDDDDDGTENSEDEESIDDNRLTPEDVVRFMNYMFPSDSDDDDDDIFDWIERHMKQIHGAPDDYQLDQKDFLPPRPNPLIYRWTPATTATTNQSPDDVFDEISDKFPELKVGAVPRKTMYTWVRILAQGLGKETRGLQGNLGELLHMCYELQWRKANPSAS